MKEIVEKLASKSEDPIRSASPGLDTLSSFSTIVGGLTIAPCGEREGGRQTGVSEPQRAPSGTWCSI
jgi:hypothetical protein